MKIAAGLLAFLVSASLSAQSARVIDDFESGTGWTAHPSDGVELRISSAPGLHGKALRLDFDFHGGAGYAIARRAVDITLPANYAFSFQLLASPEVQANDLEFKLVDGSGDNVWWANRRGFDYPKKWTEIATRKRQISYAWGPKGGGELQRVASLEIVVTAVNGGRGTLLIDDFTLTELPPAVQGSVATGSWKGREGVQQHLIDLGARRELSGLRIDWDQSDFARDYTIEASRDGRQFDELRRVTGNRRSTQMLHLPDVETRYLRLTAQRSARGKGYAIRNVEIEPVDWAPTVNDFFSLLAKEATRGDYPRYFSREQSYWTAIGADGGEDEVLVGEDGSIEPFKGGFSIEPFLYDGELTTWSDLTASHSLMEGDLPVPSILWKKRGLTLETTAAVTNDSMLLVRYRITRESGGTEGSRDIRLFIALRPFQVNPSTQWLNLVGGASRIEQLAFGSDAVLINGTQRILTVTKPDRVGSATLDEGNIVDYLRRGEVGAESALQRSDPNGRMSGALEYRLQLAPGQQRDLFLVVPLATPDAAQATLADPAAGLTAVVDEWREKLHRITFELPAAPEVADAVRTSIAYMLMHRDGPSLEPGTRSYDRAWIRDGALMATLLLQFQHSEVAKVFATWFAKYQFKDGKVPCCVDRRGADPVPENDSHGQLIYLVAEIYRHTGDKAFVQGLWPNVDAAARYIEKLRSENRGEFEGLVTESISHEGYSAKPMHSYWDDFFALRGMSDAVFLAGELGFEERRRELVAQEADFKTDLAASLRRTITTHKIDYIPGAAELGDFDATSTAIGISPLNMTALLPPRELARTFERYLESLEKPRNDYTPYEMRNIGALIRLGQKKHVTPLIERFMRDRRPAAWNSWAEVVATDPRRPIFIGDMPHAWVASDFVRSILDAIAFDREDGALVIGAGVPAAWITEEALRVGPLGGESGTIEVSMQRVRGKVEINLSGNARPKKLVVHVPDAASVRRVTVNGRKTSVRDGVVTVRKLPAKLALTY